MNPLRRTLLAALAVSPLALSQRFAHAQGEAGWSTLPNALPVENPAKVEVAEFFWYGCIHCYNLETLLEGWLPKLPADAYFRRIPAIFNDRWALDGAIYYAFESLGVLPKLHRPFFDAIHKDRLKTDDPAALTQWLTKNGVDPKRFDLATKSFGVQSKLKRAAQLTAASRIDGTPALMVHGRYTISTEQGGSQPGMLTNADRLIPVVRKTLTAGK
jgi:thiol:disulfide interchange protein DsbA